ncbi:MAG: dienelactone hydrolase family protein [Zoogloea sp.]|nr:dienelactone hydrolase family protein [Zoogloea sp.]
MKGRYIQVPSKDGSFAAYLAVSVDGKGPGIVLCQEIFGVNAAMREVADHLAEEGYTVLVPDLFWRQEPGVELGYEQVDFARAFALYKDFNENLGVDDIQASLTHLRSLAECSGDELGVVGYCLGGKLAYLAACRLPEVACAVAYYGVGIENALGELEGLRGRLVLHIPELDDFCPAAGPRGHRAGPGPAAAHRGLRVPRCRPCLRPAGRRPLRQVLRLARPRAQHRHPAPGARPRLQPVGPVGGAHPPRVRHPRCACHHGHHGRPALCEPHPDHDRRGGQQGPESLLPLPLRPQQPGRHAPHADLPHRGGVPGGG